jgi:hypothetical protein
VPRYLQLYSPKLNEQKSASSLFYLRQAYLDQESVNLRMATTAPACVAYFGSLDDILDDSTPGLLYLKAYLPIRDC